MKCQDVLYDINIYDPLSPKFITTHNSIKKEVFKTFKLNNLQLRAFDNFIVDPLPTILQEQKQLCIGNVSRIGKNETIKVISEYFRKRNLHDIKLSTFITSVALLIYNPLFDKLVN